ncbi:MAG: carboxypeptidase regulatory-like domain-containing protein [Myxococcaceae bacterium]|nr:carboxypeptidase regulatory-like domain-containing protein [Myxococcaceae bacterium]
MKRPAVFAAAALFLLPVAWWFMPGASEPEPVPLAKETPPTSLPHVLAVPEPVAVTPQGAGALKGRVHRRGVPVDGAKVQLKGPKLESAATAGGGLYEVTGLPPGDYLVWATEGHESSKVIGPVTVVAEVSVDLELLPSASLEGTVVDAHSREPIEGAVVTSTGGVARTDHAGRFRFEVLPAGETWIEAVAPGHQKRAEWLGLPGAKAHTGLTLALLPSARIEGIVERPGGKPVAQAQVWGEAEISERAGQICGPTLSAADGTFALDCADGPLVLAASAPGGSRVEGPRIKGTAGQTRSDVHIQLGEELAVDGTVLRGDTPVAGATLLLLDARSQRPAASGSTDGSGRFHIEGVSVGSYVVQVSAGTRHVQVGPYDQTGEGTPWQVSIPEGAVLAGRVDPAAAGVRVTWRSGEWAGPPASTTTDDKGTFRFEGVPDGVLSVEAEGPKGVASAKAKAGDDVVLRLTAAQLTVTAVDDKNLPVTDYLLILEPVTSGSTRRIPVLNPAGRFEGVVGSGTWRVLATSGQGTSQAQTVELNGPVSVRLQMPSPLSVTVVVVDAATKLPVGGAEVTFMAYVPGRWYAPARLIGPFVTDGRGEVRARVPAECNLEAKRGTRRAWSPMGHAPRDGAGRIEMALPPDGAPQNAAKRPPEVTEYEGVGMQLATDGPRVIVTQTFEGSPAEAAGIQYGDTIVAVDGQPARAPADQVIPRILGPAGSAVKLTMMRNGEQLDFVVRRRAIRY